MLEKEDLQLIRQVRIHKILAIPDNGRQIKILCPFHKEKTASFTVFPDNGYKCFGCGKSGYGGIDFCMDLGFSFKDTIKELVKYI